MALLFVVLTIHTITYRMHSVEDHVFSMGLVGRFRPPTTDRYHLLLTDAVLAGKALCWQGWRLTVSTLDNLVSGEDRRKRYIRTIL